MHLNKPCDKGTFTLIHTHILIWDRSRLKSSSFHNDVLAAKYVEVDTTADGKSSPTVVFEIAREKQGPRSSLSLAIACMLTRVTFTYSFAETLTISRIFPFFAGF